MEQSDFHNPVWRRLVLNEIQVNLNFLAAKVLLSRLRITIKNSASSKEIESAKKEIFDLYFRSKELPNAKKDIMVLLNK